MIVVIYELDDNSEADVVHPYCAEACREEGEKYLQGQLIYGENPEWCWEETTQCEQCGKVVAGHHAET